MTVPRIRNVRRAETFLLIVLVIAGLARCWGIGFGLPHTECRPDETTILRIALKFGTGDLNPHFFRYPTLYMYVLSCLYICTSCKDELGFSKIVIIQGLRKLPVEIVDIVGPPKCAKPPARSVVYEDGKGNENQQCFESASQCDPAPFPVLT